MENPKDTQQIIQNPLKLILRNLRLLELVLIAKRNKPFFDEFVSFIISKGYQSVYEFIIEPDNQKAISTISDYFYYEPSELLFDGLLRPYPPNKAKWFFISWLFRDAATQRLQPLLSNVPGKSDIERKTFLLNELRIDVGPLFPDPHSWEWPAFNEIMITRLEGSRRALKGTRIEELVRSVLRDLINTNHLSLIISNAQVKVNDETYDIEVKGKSGTLLIPVKTRETMGGGHALLFTRDIHKSINSAIQIGYHCIPVVIAESWSGNLDTLKSEKYIYIQANPNQLETIEPMLREKLFDIISILKVIE
ncbi:MAG: hypothetical protein A2X25_09235 [Chloroflexi bacterium GWB2_49_20]|nr:MAG: hypothetical protein A2X25_09235 [Chloroflexi bacterium GWB2_49_20]OGN79390.1 MAG: hypothetical protein A2X26_04790 [Chloroflexi bacterium GWC2_49_37]OGN82840.1 MAG: hypothetical protein A2X27_07905 [Chloroflexi bacterium GWD2_49_16]HCC78490.1 hypothetical protein [Anaerolineae bacterium]HCM97315.1 hypothetical protein [Anaerolineae bacterium]